MQIGDFIGKLFHFLKFNQLLTLTHIRSDRTQSSRIIHDFNFVLLFNENDATTHNAAYYLMKQVLVWIMRIWWTSPKNLCSCKFKSVLLQFLYLDDAHMKFKSFAAMTKTYDAFFLVLNFFMFWDCFYALKICFILVFFSAMVWRDWRIEKFVEKNRWKIFLTSFQDFLKFSHQICNNSQPFGCYKV